MAILEYFKLSFKKPELDENLSNLIKQRKGFEERIESCYSRLESIEICNNNSKYDDAILLSKYLSFDITNLILWFLDKPELKKPEEMTEYKFDFLDSEVKEILTSIQNAWKKNYKNREEEAQELEETLNKGLFEAEKILKQKNAETFNTPLDKYKKRLRFQGIILLAIFGIAAFGIFREMQKYAPLPQDTAQLYYTTNEKESFSEKGIVAINYIPTSDWKVLSFKLPQPSSLYLIRFDPITKDSTRIQISNVKYVNDNGKVIFERDFKINELGMVDRMEEILSTTDLKPGNIKKGSYLEFETSSNDSSITLKLQKSENVSEVQVTMRAVKNSVKFR